jgi:hypothetical protein
MCSNEMIGYGAKQGAAVLRDLVRDGHGKSAMYFSLPPTFNKEQRT